MTSVAFRREACGETYEEIERMICKICWWFVENCHGEFDDYLSAANEAFVEAFHSYVPGRSQFTTWTYNRVRWRLIRSVNERNRHAERTTGEIDLDGFAKPSPFDLMSWTAELSDDAGVVVRLLVQTPIEMGEEVAKLTRGRSTIKASDIRCGLARQLREAGWTVARIVESFSEIREALT